MIRGVLRRGGQARLFFRASLPPDASQANPQRSPRQACRAAAAGLSRDLPQDEVSQEEADCQPAWACQDAALSRARSACRVIRRREGKRAVSGWKGQRQAAIPVMTSRGQDCQSGQAIPVRRAENRGVQHRVQRATLHPDAARALMRREDRRGDECRELRREAGTLPPDRYSARACLTAWLRGQSTVYLPLQGLSNRDPQRSRPETRRQGHRHIKNRRGRQT
jgi:hypothetical protein